jgi:pilus assembly protein CpaC
MSRAGRPLSWTLIAASLSALAAASPGAALAQPKPPTAPKTDAPKTESNKLEEKALGLGVGESKTLPATDVKQYSEGTAGIAEIKLTPDGKKFIISGQKAGTTSLLLIKNDGGQINWTIKVYSQAPDEVESELAQLLQGYTGVRVRKIGSRLFIEGGVQTEADLERIKQIADLYPGQVESLVTVGTGAVDRNLNVRIDFFFVQYNKDSSYGVGISWPTRIGGAVIHSNFGYDFVAGVATANATVVDQPLPALDIASANGWAKVIKQSAVITTNGNEAVFESGGEVNVPIISGTSAKLERIAFGTNVTVQPRYDPRSGNLEVKLSADISDLTPSLGTTLPGRQTAKLSTLVFLKLGESLVLSGIRTSRERHQITGLPLLSRIPVLGVFFGSHSDTDEDVEGAVFIIPSVVESVPKGTYDMVKEAMAQYEAYTGGIDDVNSFSKAPPAYGTEGGAGATKK